MTRNHDFKKLVRTRMARTNERYATARAALLGELSKTSPPKAKHDQTFALMRMLAARFGEAPTEAWLLGIGGGISFQYHAFEYAGVPPLVYFGTRCSPQYAYDDAFVSRVLVGLGCEPIVSMTTSAAKAERELIRLVEKGPVLCWVGREALLGAEDFGGATPWVVVVHDVDDGVAGVEDCSVGAMEVPLDRLTLARGAVRKQKHRLVSVGDASQAAPRDAVHAGISRCVEDLGSQIVLGGSAANFGLAALEKWTRLVVDEKNAKGWPRLFGGGRALLGGMGQMWTWLGAATDGTGFRTMYAQFLREAHRAINDDALANAATLVAANGSAWQALVDDVFTGDRDVLRAAHTILRDAANPASPKVLADLEERADRELDDDFARGFRERVHGRLEGLVRGEREAEALLAAGARRSS